MAAKTEKHVETVKLVWVEKDGIRTEVHPTTVESHKLVGWKLVATVEKVDGKVVETGQVIETPAHTVETSDGFLKTLPKDDETVPVEPAKPAVIAKTEPAPKK